MPSFVLTSDARPILGVIADARLRKIAVDLSASLHPLYSFACKESLGAERPFVSHAKRRLIQRLGEPVNRA